MSNILPWLKILSPTIKPDYAVCKFAEKLRRKGRPLIFLAQSYDTMVDSLKTQPLRGVSFSSSKIAPILFPCTGVFH